MSRLSRTFTKFAESRNSHSCSWSSIRFSAGGWQPKWGDKLSSVLDITYKEPDSISGSITAGLLGGSVEAEGITKEGRLSWVASARHKSARYLLGTLDVQGEYLPRFSDIQAFLTYRLAPRHTLHGLFSYARNRYEVTPQTRETNFGTLQQAFRLTVGFEGQELLQYDTWQNALKWSSRWTERLNSRSHILKLRSAPANRCMVDCASTSRFIAPV